MLNRKGEEDKCNVHIMKICTQITRNVLSAQDYDCDYEEEELVTPTYVILATVTVSGSL